MNTRIYLFAVLALTVLASGCTGGTPDAETPSEEDSPVGNPDEAATNMSEVDRTITVSGGNYYFEPDTINVSVNETVRFVLENEGGFHDLVIPALDSGTERINGGETSSFTVKFTEEGSYDFICSVGNHAQRGMRGTIQVS